MRERVIAAIAYTGAALTLLVAACVPFLLIGIFTNAVAHAGLHVDDAYTGGAVTRRIDRGSYQIAVYEPVYPRGWQRIEPFVQIDFSPASALPAQVNDAIDLDGDGQPDVRISFAMPTTSLASPRGDVIALNGKYASLKDVGGDSFSRLLVQTGTKIVVRVPLRAGGR